MVPPLCIKPIRLLEQLPPLLSHTRTHTTRIKLQVHQLDKRGPLSSGLLTASDLELDVQSEEEGEAESEQEDQTDSEQEDESDSEQEDEAMSEQQDETDNGKGDEERSRQEVPR